MYDEINRMKSIHGLKHSEQQAGQHPQPLRLRDLLRLLFPLPFPRRLRKSVLLARLDAKTRNSSTR